MKRQTSISNRHVSKENMQLLESIAIGVMFALGVYQLLQRNVIRMALGLVITSNAINLFLLSIGAYNGVVESYAKAMGVRSDALPLALILTAIVISMGTLMFTLALLRVLTKRYATRDNEAIAELKH